MVSLAGVAVVTRRGLRPQDRLTLAFSALMLAVLLATAARSPSWPIQVGAFALVLLLVWLMTRAPADTPFMRFIGPGYPLLLTTGFYTAIGTLNEELGRNHDLWAQHADAALFGGQVSVTWHAAWPWAPLSWALHLGYQSYYLLVIGVALWHWRRAPIASYERAVFNVCLAFFTCYAVFALWPVTGPRYFFGVATGPAAEVWPARLAHAVLEGGSAYGTAFPSSHIAASWSAVAVTWLASRRLAVALGVPALLLAFGTVYGQFHYAVDAVAGALLAVVLVPLAAWLYRALGAPRTAAPAMVD